ncbi:hypothetical protein AAG570_012935 [Ranatra chinensis]|uniref:Tubulin delta chain n=1 Tax=Ranatra chinensis TaxID=642074 RepID=A0ABD0YFF3_9HEMI
MGNKHLRARSILVDTEDKVISRLKFLDSEPNAWSFSAENVVINNRGGCGNNWAVGYTECGPESCVNILEKIRKETEKCDNIMYFLTLGSTGGGTGSGFSSYIIEAIRSEYSHKVLMASFVLPYSDGDVNTQNLNTIFTLSKCYSVCDAIVLFNNSSIHKQLNSCKKFGYFDMNRFISEQLSCFLQPFSNFSSISGVYDILMPLISHPQYKLLALMANSSECHTKFNAISKWETLIRNLNFKLRKLDLPNVSRIRDTRLSNQYLEKCIANLLVCRGADSILTESVAKKHFGSSDYYPLWTPKSERFSHLYHNRKFCDYNEYALLVSNNRLICKDLNNILERGWCSYVHNAYIHHYKKYSFEQEDMINAFSKVENILKCYSSL